MSEIKTDYDFYKSVQKTNPAMTKNQKTGGRTVTSIDPYYQQENATKEWGLYGKTWGIKDTSIKIRMYGTTEIMTLNGVFWFPEGEFPYSVSEKSFYISSKGNDIIDMDVEKKLYTSFKSKCLSLLGFNTDIFLGKFEDQNYVNEVYGETTMINVPQTQELIKLIQDTETELEAFLKAFSINKLSDMPIKDFEKAKAMLLSKLNKMKKNEAKN